MKTVNLSRVPEVLHSITKIRNEAIVTLYDNVQELQPDEEGNPNFSADMYRIKVPWREGLESIDYSVWLVRAKELETAASDADKRIARDTLM